LLWQTPKVQMRKTALLYCTRVKGWPVEPGMGAFPEGSTLSYGCTPPLYLSDPSIKMIVDTSLHVCG